MAPIRAVADVTDVRLIKVEFTVTTTVITGLKIWIIVRVMALITADVRAANVISVVFCMCRVAFGGSGAPVISVFAMALITACPTKLKPILMSNIAIILGMLPMAMGIGASGSEIRRPMGVVSIGGLIASTLLALIVIPVLYNVVSNGKSKRKKEK